MVGLLRVVAVTRCQLKSGGLTAYDMSMRGGATGHRRSRVVVSRGAARP